MIILGIDPGSRITGYGLIKREAGAWRHVENGSLYLTDHETFPERLLVLHQKISELIKKYGVTDLVVENIFFHKNPKSAQKLGEVRGVILLSGELAGVNIHEYTALQIKNAVTGYGKASKEQVQGMVRKILGLKDLAEENASDALAGALCHGHQSGSRLKVVAAGPDQKSTAKNDVKELLKKASFYR